MNLAEIEDSLLDDTFKGIPGGTRPFRLGDIGLKGWNVLREDMPLPIAVIRRSAVEHNSRWMRCFLTHYDALHAPHGKTFVSPQIYVKELAEGAWGVTVATIHQLQVFRHFGVKRILFANQLVGRAGIHYVLDELARDPQFDFYCLVDSVECVEILATAIGDRRPTRPVQVLLEIGFDGGRAGCRSIESAVAVAQAIRAFEPDIVLCGVEVYAGVIDEPTIAESIGQVRSILESAVHIAKVCDQKGLLRPGPIIFCAGCSHYFDLVPIVARIADVAQRLRVVTRSGSYLFFDSRWYAERFEATLERLSEVPDLAAGLEASVEIWGYVQSLPEPQRAIFSLGRRETSFAFGLPVPLTWYRPSVHSRPQPLSNRYRVTALNDHHAFVELPADSPLHCGDMVSLGASVPTATFDRWRLVFVVDDDYNVVAALKNFS